MKFVKREDLKEGMRLGKPIYNKKGVLLYERDSKLTRASIESARNFGLMGVYVLEPTEPLPPMSDEDVEFEKFQIVSEFALMDELNALKKTGKIARIRQLADKYVSQFARINHPINFVQNLRGAEDYVIKHSSNVAILCALIGSRLGMRFDELGDTILAALVHDIGKLDIPVELVVKEELEPEDEVYMKKCELHGAEIIESCFSSIPAIKRIMMQAFRHQDSFETGQEKDSAKMVLGAKILMVANTFDNLTAMDIRHEPLSRIGALKFIMSNPEWYEPDIVKGLVDSVSFLAEGTSVELSNGETALVLSTNPRNLLKPMVLIFSSNTIIDLARSSVYEGLEVVDILKSFDSRHVMDTDALKK